MHYIQKSILDRLRSAETMRYAQIIPEGIESGHFRYHLKQLETEGLVRQSDRGLYELTYKGLKTVDSLSAGRVNPHKMPKVITYTLLIDGNKVVLHRKNKQPYMGLLNMVGGKVHQDETVQQAAAREVYEKSGFQIDQPELLGTAEVMISSRDSLLTHVIAFVFSSKADAAAFGDDFVAIEPDELKSRPDLAPDFPDLYDLIKKGSFGHAVLQIKNT